MGELEQQVRRARRRLGSARFLHALGWCWFGSLLVALVLIAVDRLYPMSLAVWGWAAKTDTTSVASPDQETLILNAAAAIAGGTLVLGLLAAVVWMVLTRRPELTAAMEIDQRFGLKERVSSSLALSPDDRAGAAGQALIDDAVRRVERIDVASQFNVRPRKSLLLPLVPGLLAAAIALFIGPALIESPKAKADIDRARKQIRTATAKLNKKLVQRRREAEEKGLKEAQELFDKLERGTRRLGSNTADRKQATRDLNDLAEQLKRRRKELGGAEKMRQQIDRLKNTTGGPAQKFAKAVGRGDFKAAADELQAMKDKLAQGNLDEDEKKKLADQLNKMQAKLAEAAAAQEAARRDIEQRIQQLSQSGQLAEADKLQDQLDRMMQQPQLNELSDLANQLGLCSQALQNGQMGKANEALSRIQSTLDGLSQDLDEMEMIDGTLQQLAQARMQMNCNQCGGRGCRACNGQGMGGGGPGKGWGDGPGGSGVGAGARPEEENETDTVDSQYKPKVGRGSGAIIGEVGGPNIAGDTREEIKQQLDTFRRGETDPLANRRIPRKQRQHVQEYLDRFREGQ